MKNENAKCACQGGTLTRFVQPIILFSLAEAPDHGYELLQKISKTDLWNDAPPDAAGVYRVLRDMEKRGLVRSHLDPDSKAGMGKRVFEISEEGRACMNNWVDTLEKYRRGIDQIIVHLREALNDRPAAGQDSKASISCCCKKATDEV